MCAQRPVLHRSLPVELFGAQVALQTEQNQIPPTFAISRNSPHFGQRGSSGFGSSKV